MIRKTVKVLALTLLLTTLSMAQKEALLVGVSDYAGTENDFSDGIEQDIANMKSLFEQWGFKVTVLFNKDSLKLDNYLNDYSQNLKENDKFVFYYSGHGYQISDENGDEVDDKQDEILEPI
ncbi:MAG: Metacaspase [uncultured Sulfurovum sp.]|uniref:Metacaspase n=1 Tax=uncultured Sulfurovum sp. TaxID=269237 RepID=A0A6S6TJM6_9BACT|nr:MAG: Metacaspase [uncultured Sulfurovum sp.]